MATCIVCNSLDSVPFSKKNGHDIVRCTACGLLFVYPIHASSSDIYNRDYFEGASKGFGYVNYDEDKEPMKPVFLKYLNIIDAELGGKRGKLLDVGAATGYFVRLARDAGYDAEGVDISEHAAMLGRAKGLRVHTGTIEDASGIYDCITMLDLIEHVPDPRAVIKKAASLLRRRGVLIINAPDAGSLLARILGRYWHLISPPEHLYYFNRSNMRRLLDEEGFDVARMTTIGKWFTIKYIFKVLGRSTHIGLFQKISSFFSNKSLTRLSLPVNLRDNMFVVARRR
ncbi:MAG: class I SAM-dependent methyltransferase [bacterium]|nr:class I SAM-dependent methyltransferase [bacterium]